MSGVTGDFAALEELAEKFRKLTTSEARIELSKNLAEEYTDFMVECFRESRSPYGQAWEPLRFRSSGGGRGQKPLLNSGLMRGATSPVDIREYGFTVQVGRDYASTHQKGATIVPRNAKALRFAGVIYEARGRGRARRKGTGFIFRKKVVVPARPFAPINGMPDELQERLDEAGSEFIHDYFGE